DVESEVRRPGVLADGILPVSAHQRGGYQLFDRLGGLSARRALEGYLPSKSKRSFADALRQLASVIGALALLQFFREHFLRARLADSRHCFHLELIGNAQLHSRAFVVKAFHAVHHEALPKTLQREILPRCPGIVGMSDRRFVVVIERLSRNKENKDSGILGPNFVRFDKETKEQRPMLGLTARVESAPLLSVE